MESSESDEIAPINNHAIKVEPPVVKAKYHKKKLQRVLDNRQQNKEAHAIAAARKAATVKTIKVPVKLQQGVDVMIKPRIVGGLSKATKDKIKEKEDQKPPSDLDAYL